MPKLTITIDIDNPPNEADLALLLRDALGEFMSTRTPVDEYVAKRYQGESEKFLTNKGYEVRKRLLWADALHSASSDITITTGADELLRAAAPEMSALLNEACQSLDAAESASKSHCTADRIRRRMSDLHLWALRNDDEREDPESTDPNAGPPT
jgi:hypothetical protein